MNPWTPSIAVDASVAVEVAASVTDASSLGATDLDVASLFEDCGHRLARYVRSFGLGTPETEEIVQDVFLSLVHHLNRGGGQTNLRGWIFRVGHNLALKARRRSMRSASALADPALPMPEVPATPEQDCLDRERQDRLLSIVHALAERDRQCLLLRAEGLRYREIGKALGMSLGAVAASLGRSFSKLATVDQR